MRRTLLLSSVAMLSGIAIAAAQMPPGGNGGDKKGAISRDAAPSMKGSPQGAADRRGGPDQGQAQGKGAQGKGQASETQGRGDQGQSKTRAGQIKDKDNKKSRAQGRKQDGKGQAKQPQKDDKSQARTKRDKNEARRLKDQTVGQGSGQGAAKDGQSKQQQGRQLPTQQKSADQKVDARGSVTLSAEQRTRVRETILARRDVPRVTRVDFSLRVGIAVPTRIRLAAVPAVLIDIHPEWRGHQFFVVREEIVIVDRSRRIVAVVPAGPSQARGGSGGAAFVDLGPDEIREVQLVLIERGFLVGEADGVFGPRTRAALVVFQRREGITVTGRIDDRTVTALGVSAKINRSGGKDPSASQSSTTGQGAQPSSKQGTSDKNRSSGQSGSQPSQGPSTSGQGSDPSPSSKQGQGAKKNGATVPSTTGQGKRSNDAAPPASRGGQAGEPATKSPPAQSPSSAK